MFSTSMLFIAKYSSSDEIPCTRLYVVLKRLNSVNRTAYDKKKKAEQLYTFFSNKQPYLVNNKCKGVQDEKNLKDLSEILTRINNSEQINIHFTEKGEQNKKKTSKFCLNSNK